MVRLTIGRAKKARRQGCSEHNYGQELKSFEGEVMNTL